MDDGEALEEARLFFFDSFGPYSVVSHYFLEISHLDVISLGGHIFLLDVLDNFVVDAGCKSKLAVLASLLSLIGEVSCGWV